MASRVKMQVKKRQSPYTYGKAALFTGGEGGIRTLGRLHVTRFPIVHPGFSTAAFQIIYGFPFFLSHDYPMKL